VKREVPPSGHRVGCRKRALRFEVPLVEPTSIPSCLSPSSFLLTIGLFFPLGGLALTLMAMSGIELDAPNVKLLFVTVESMYVTCEAAASS
jgi:hypothetical protein